METSFVEFEFDNNKRFELLAKTFNELRTAKQSDEFPPDEYWVPFFDQEALSYFWQPTKEEKQDWLRRWQATPVPQRMTDPSLQPKWSFGSMLDAFRNGEYELVRCVQKSPDRGRLEFIPYAWPFGGTGCMRVLLEAFGCRVVGESE